MTTSPSQRWVRRPEGSTWGDFGPDDALGRLNLLTPTKVAEGIKEVVSAEAFALGLPVTFPGGTALNANRLPPVLRPNLRSGHPNVNCHMDTVYPGASDIMNDDVVILHNQYSTQWDALAHVGSLFDADGDGIEEPVYYNGFRPGIEVKGPTDPADCGLETRPLVTTSDLGPVGVGTIAEHAIQGRAVMVDLALHFGTAHQRIGHKEWLSVLEKDQLDIRPGDIVTIHTGYAEKVLEMKGEPDPDVLHSYGCVLDGRDQDLLSWISSSRIAALVADNYAVELYPAVEAAPPASVLPLHEHCLFKLGVPLGELWRLTPLATRLRELGRSAYLLTAPPLNIPGASGSPLNPIATI
ncbi:MAG: cyclase family protein [Galactobacter sp.]